MTGSESSKLTMEVKEEFVKLNKEDVGTYLKSFKATTSIVYAAEKWKNKSVSFVCPRPELILKKHLTEVQEFQSPKDNFFSNLLDYFKDAKVSDVNHDENDIGNDSPYKHWATRIIKPSKKVEDIEESDRDNALDNSIVAVTPFKCPKLEVRRKSSEYCDYNREIKLKLPLSYNGSKMLMPNGDQLFWVRIDGRLQDGFVTSLRLYFFNVGFGISAVSDCVLC